MRALRQGVFDFGPRPFLIEALHRVNLAGTHFRSCYALWPRQNENSHHLPVGFAADNADETDFRGFFGLKRIFSAKIRDDPIFQRHPRRIERWMIGKRLEFDKKFITGSSPPTRTSAGRRTNEAHPPADAGVWRRLSKGLTAFRSCYALCPRQIENSHHLSVEFAADNADSTDLHGFFGLKKDFFCENPR